MVISIHAPREGCDWALVLLLGQGLLIFQSTHPARGATVILLSIPSVSMYFNPRTPRGVRHIAARNFANAIMISIHAPREGCDLVSDGAEVLRAIFQSTHPARGATGQETASSSHIRTDFNPRTPRGVRPQRVGCLLHTRAFQSTHPARGATWTSLLVNAWWMISIHAPREGCD